MSRLSLLLLLSLLAAVVDPDLRAISAPYAERALAPVYEWSARSRVSEIARALETDVARGRSLPEPDRLQTFLRQHFPGVDAATDPWDSPYYLLRDPWSARVGSAGRDRVPGTGDDILSPALALSRL